MGRGGNGAGFAEESSEDAENDAVVITQWGWLTEWLSIPSFYLYIGYLKKIQRQIRCIILVQVHYDNLSID